MWLMTGWAHWHNRGETLHVTEAAFKGSAHVHDQKLKRDLKWLKGTTLSELLCIQFWDEPCSWICIWRTSWRWSEHDSSRRTATDHFGMKEDEQEQYMTELRGRLHSTAPPVNHPHQSPFHRAQGEGGGSQMTLANFPRNEWMNERTQVGMTWVGQWWSAKRRRWLSFPSHDERD